MKYKLAIVFILELALLVAVFTIGWAAGVNSQPDCTVSTDVLKDSKNEQQMYQGPVSGSIEELM